MASQWSRWVFILFFISFVSHHARASSEKQKLLKWVHENSDMFVMLKHWNDLPLISTAWKRLKTTPAVQEDRKNFLKSVEYFLELWGDQMEIKLHSVSNSNISTVSRDHAPKVNTTLQATLLLSNITVPSSQSYLKESLEVESNGSLTISELKTSAQKEAERTTESDGRQSSKIDNGSSLNVSNETPLNSCSTDSPFDAMSFLKNYEDEKRWIRSQLTPLNYLFEKLKTIEEKISRLESIPCTTEVKGETIQRQEGFNTTASESLRPAVDSQLLVRIEKLELITKTFSSEYQNLSATVLSIQESTKTAMENLESLLSRAASLIPGYSDRNNTEDVEYCPEHLDEKVPCAEVGNSCYCFSKLQKNWTSALDFCKKNDMLLLSLETQQESDLIASYIKEAGLPREFYWTSGNDEANEGKWIWISTQQNITVENWRSNQPDGGLKENCLYLHSRDEFKWGDWMCNLPQYFICEW